MCTIIKFANKRQRCSILYDWKVMVLFKMVFCAHDFSTNNKFVKKRHDSDTVNYLNYVTAKPFFIKNIFGGEILRKKIPF